MERTKGYIDPATGLPDTAYSQIDAMYLAAAARADGNVAAARDYEADAGAFCERDLEDGL